MSYATDCYWYAEEQDMNAYIPYCKCKDIYPLDDCDCDCCNEYHSKYLRTNANRIRQMTDEELAEWMIEQEKYVFSFFGVQLSEEVNQHNKEQYLVWLKKEVDDEHID